MDAVICWYTFSKKRNVTVRRSRSFKVTDFGTNRKLIYDFLLVINTNLPPILDRFQDMADYYRSGSRRYCSSLQAILWVFAT